MLAGLALDAEELIFGRMSAQKFLLLPAELTSARLRSGLLQKSAAAAARIGQTVLCAIEKGRRTPDDAGVLERLAVAYELGESGREDLLFAAAHDHLMLSIKGTRLEPAAGLLSAALKTHRMLATSEADGLVLELRDIAQGKRRVNDLARRARATPLKEEAPM